MKKTLTTVLMNNNENASNGTNDKANEALTSAATAQIANTNQESVAFNQLESFEDIVESLSNEKIQELHDVFCCESDGVYHYYRDLADWEVEKSDLGRFPNLITVDDVNRYNTHIDEREPQLRELLCANKSDSVFGNLLWDLRHDKATRDELYELVMERCEEIECEEHDQMVEEVTPALQHFKNAFSLVKSRRKLIQTNEQFKVLLECYDDWDAVRFVHKSEDWIKDPLLKDKVRELKNRMLTTEFEIEILLPSVEWSSILKLCETNRYVRREVTEAIADQLEKRKASPNMVTKLVASISKEDIASLWNWYGAVTERDQSMQEGFALIKYDHDLENGLDQISEEFGQLVEYQGEVRAMLLKYNGFERLEDEDQPWDSDLHEEIYEAITDRFETIVQTAA